jgi:hypothetical protein
VEKRWGANTDRPRADAIHAVLLSHLGDYIYPCKTTNLRTHSVGGSDTSGRQSTIMLKPTGRWSLTICETAINPGSLSQ